MTDPDAAFQTYRYRTDDADEGHAFIQQAYVDVAVTIRGDPHEFHLASETVQAGSVLVHHLQHSIPVGMHARDGVTWQAVFQSRGPKMALEARQQDHRLGPDDPIALQPGVPYTCAWESYDADIVDLDLQRAADQAAVHSGSRRPFRFEFGTAVSPVAAQHWRQTVDLVRRISLANAHRPSSALLADQLAGLLTTAALTCFRSTATPDDTPRPARTSPASLRRAIAYVDSHLDQPIRLTDLATAARVSPRALNLTFHRHLGTSPLGYVRRARLDRAHHELSGARPEDGTTVTEVAARWGFGSLPRFAAAYRTAYGRLPGQTLRKG